MSPLFRRRIPEDASPRTQPPSLDPRPLVEHASSSSVEITGRDLFLGFEQGWRDKAEARRGEAPHYRHQVNAALRRAFEVVDGKENPYGEAAIEMGRWNLGPREDVAGNQVKLYGVLQRAMAVRRPGEVSQEEALQSKGAIGLTQVALATPAARRGTWLADCQVGLARMEQQLSSMEARASHHIARGASKETVNAMRQQELADVAFGLQGLGFKGLPYEVNTLKPGIRIEAASAEAGSELTQASAMLAFVQGARFSAEEGGSGSFRTARDVVRGAAENAAVSRQDPSVSPYLVADAATMAAFGRVRDSLLSEGTSAGQAITRDRLPQLEAKLSQHIDSDLAAQIGISAALSAGQPFENREVRDMALALNGDPAFRTDENARRAAMKHLASSPEVRAYRAAASTLMECKVEDAPNAMKQFQEAAVSLQTTRPAAMMAAVVAGWGPLGVLAAAAATSKSSASDLRDARIIAQQVAAEPGFPPFAGPNSKTRMEPSDRGQDAKAFQLSHSGLDVRVFGFDQNGSPMKLYQGPIAAAPLQEPVKKALDEVGADLNAPLGRIRLAQVGVLNLDSVGVPVHARSAYMVEPVVQAPPLRDLRPWGEDGLPLAALNQDSMRTARAHA